MDITITPTALKGIVTPPPSKSQAHRLLLAAALAQGESVISNVALSQDIAATIRCLEELGAYIRMDGSTATVRGMAAGPMSPLRRMALPIWTAESLAPPCASSSRWLWPSGAGGSSPVTAA